MPIDKARQVLARERRLLVCERGQRQVWVGRDPLAVALRNGSMLRRALRRFAPLRPAHPSRTNLVLWLKLNALLLEAAMVDASWLHMVDRMTSGWKPDGQRRATADGQRPQTAVDAQMARDQAYRAMVERMSSAWRRPVG